jgi:hypothetical protein
VTARFRVLFVFVVMNVCDGQKQTEADVRRRWAHDLVALRGNEALSPNNDPSSDTLKGESF